MSVYGAQLWSVSYQTLWDCLYKFAYGSAPSHNLLVTWLYLCPSLECPVLAQFQPHLHLIAFEMAEWFGLFFYSCVFVCRSEKFLSPDQLSHFRWRWPLILLSNINSPKWKWRRSPRGKSILLTQPLNIGWKLWLESDRKGVFALRPKP